MSRQVIIGRIADFSIRKNKVRLNKIKKNKFRRALLRTALHGINIIQDRMDAGVTIKGAPFKRYSKEYLKYRLKKGRQAKPNLAFTGQMQSGMTTTATSRMAKIFFTRPVDAKKARANNKTRPFFGFSNSEKEKLKTKFLKGLR